MARIQIQLNSGHVVFASHFPGEPILPGACIVQMVAEMVSLWKDGNAQKTLPIVKMSNLKFLTVISPVEVCHLMVVLEMKEMAEGLMKVAASVRTEEKEYSKMTLTFAYGE